MKKFAKFLLGLTIVLFVLGLLVVVRVIPAAQYPVLNLLLPAGAICFGIFMVWHVLEKETAAYDAEQRAHHSPPGGASKTEEHFNSHQPGRA